ncbi:unnamed protein product [Owenia fusiformis]|uniref:Putative hydroxypyruvate isomerase n=1 Tax=Owenia fusiformis TaxID=6347 RepID=A0A8J1U6S4_OWEFU|nr:unnamed protein product [Owenia fusiformis]
MTTLLVCKIGKHLILNKLKLSFSSYTTVKMPLKFAANVSMLFQENGTLDKRYKVAENAGFKYVECTFPYDIPIETLQSAKESANVEQVLVNGWPGDMTKGDVGISALPDRIEEFREKLETSIKYANALNCKRMHIMAARVTDKFTTKQMEAVYIENLKYAADRLQKEGILALIEAVNSRISVPGYLMDHPQKAVEIIEKVNHPNLKMQLDLFHVQIMDGNLTGNIKKYLPYTGHIQIAQVPKRGEPDTEGEINYPYVFKVLEESGYDGYIGLEYIPAGKTLDGLKWMKIMGF